MIVSQVQEVTQSTRGCHLLGPPKAIELEQTNQVRGLFTILRNSESPRSEFIFYANRLFRRIIERALDTLPVETQSVNLANGKPYDGVKFRGKICGVSIMRAGESMEESLRDCCPSARIGKILIQRDEDTAKPRLFYDKLPQDISTRHVFLLDPMLATGGSALMAIDKLVSSGVPPARISFLNLVSSPEGLETVFNRYPELQIITGCIDSGLDERKRITPGLGDFGDRYYSH